MNSINIVTVYYVYPIGKTEESTVATFENEAEAIAYVADNKGLTYVEYLQAEYV